MPTEGMEARLPQETSAPTGVSYPVRSKDRVNIVGFAPSWTETPWHEDAEFWGLNSLHRVAEGRPWTRWFQLHDIDEHHGDDPDHLMWLRQTSLPVYVWPEHVAKYSEKYGFTNLIPYPRDWILNEFGTYFTNSISWMMALAIAENFSHMGVYGVDMAQDTVIGGEYSQQRPSCEYFIGLARGRGISVTIPDTSDLLKTLSLYGMPESDAALTKFRARRQELAGRKSQHDQQVQAHQQASLQLAGAIENLDWLIRTWMNPTSRVGTGGTPNA
ncbi:MAG: hypothetical protein R3324_03545 [Halobacteriales archaeon]|nr:hypothetical protein [Halobacteriales archaeon]